MPKLDFLIPGQFVRQHAGLMDVLGLGIDTMHLAEVPTAHPLHLALRVTFDSTDTPGHKHRFTFVWSGDDETLATVGATLIAPPKIESVPVYWKTGVAMAIPLMVPVPRYGNYSLTLAIDDELAGELDFRAIPIQQGARDAG